MGTFVPGAAIFARLGRTMGKQAGLSDKLAKLVSSDKASTAVTMPVEQSQILQQHTNVIARLSMHAPLLLVLDDAQWADSAHRIHAKQSAFHGTAHE